MTNNKIDKIINKTPNIIIIFLYIQPLLDIIAAFLLNNNLSNNITTIIRFLFMSYMIIYLLVAKYNNKKQIIMYLAIIILNITIHLSIQLIYKTPNVLIFELKNTISTFYFLFIILAFIIIYKTNKFNKKHIINILIIYLSLTIIPNILGLSYDSYDKIKVGSSGLFYSANALGSILIILFSLIISELKEMKTSLKIILIISLIYVSLTLGTKTPVLGLIIIIGINLLYLIYKIIKNKNKKAITITLVITLVSFIGVITIVPKTSFYKNLNIHINYLKDKNVNIISTKFIDHFIFSSRFKKEKVTRNYYKNAHTLEKIFGIGYIEGNTMDINKYRMIEIDYLDIFYKEGIIAFIIYFLPIIYLIKITLKNTKLTFNGINKIIPILLILLIAFFQGHMFTSPAVSIFIAITLVINSINKENYVV